MGAIAQPQPIQSQSLQAKTWVQRQGTGELQAPSGVEKAIADTQGRGAPLADDVRQPMEQAFGGIDFSGVRIHTDQQSNQLNQVVQAKAFTTKQDIYFRNGAYDPGSQSGQTLLAHELTHVVQQTGMVQKADSPSTPSHHPSQPPEISTVASTPPTISTPTERLAQPQIQRWALPTDWLDYLGLAIDVGERIYIEMAYEEGEEKDYQRFMNNFFFVVDAILAATPGAGGGGVAMRSSRQFAAAGWNAIPNPVRNEIIEELARRMGWSTTRVIQALHHMMMSSSSGSQRRRDRWSCQARCNVQQIDHDADCPPRVEGMSSGPSQETACREAKRVATQSAPRGCYVRHCRCFNCKRN